MSFTLTGSEPHRFYLCDYLKENVYQNNTQTIPELMITITAETKVLRRARKAQVHVWCIRLNGDKTKIYYRPY